MARHRYFCPTCKAYPTTVTTVDGAPVCGKCRGILDPVTASAGGVNMVALKVDGKRYSERDIAAIQRGTYSGSVGRSQ